MNKEYKLKYGKGEVKFSLDPSLVIEKLVINEFPALSDPTAAIREAIRKPIGSKPLNQIVKPGQTVAFIVNDLTRVANSYVFMPNECSEGTGSELYEKTMDKYRTPGEVEAALRQNFQIGAHKAYAVTRLMNKAEFVLVSALGEQLAKKLLFTPAKNINEALEMAFTKFGPRPTITLMPMGIFTVPLKHTPIE